VRSLIQGSEESFYGLLGGEVGGFDGEPRQTGVEGMTPGEAELGGDGVFKDRAGDVLEHTAVEESREGGIEEDGEGVWSLFEEEAIREFFRGASAEGQDGVAATQGRGEGGGLETTELGFTMEREELRDGGTGALLEVGVEIKEVPAQAVGEEASDGGLTRSHEAGEDKTTDCG
jgi:hypothetical protein